MRRVLPGLLLCQLAYACAVGGIPRSDSVYPEVAYNAPRYSGSCPARLVAARASVLVPTGSFTRGAAPGEGNDDEHPQGLVVLTGYLLDVNEVTVGDYRRCVEAGLCDATWVGTQQMAGQRPTASPYCTYRPGNDAHPMTCVSWFEAQRFCQCHGQRLPTESEWERSARGDADARRFPWGDAAPSELATPPANLADATAAERFSGFVAVPGYRDGHAVTAPVGSFATGRSPHGVDDLGGNVTEWTESPYDPAAWRRGESAELSPIAAPLRVARGAAFDSDPVTLRLTRRWPFLPWDRSHSLGFRCVSSARQPRWAPVSRARRSPEIPSTLEIER